MGMTSDELNKDVTELRDALIDWVMSQQPYAVTSLHGALANVLAGSIGYFAKDQEHLDSGVEIIRDLITRTAQMSFDIKTQNREQLK